MNNLLYMEKSFKSSATEFVSFFESGAINPKRQVVQSHQGWAATTNFIIIINSYYFIIFITLSVIVKKNNLPLCPYGVDAQSIHQNINKKQYYCTSLSLNSSIHQSTINKCFCMVLLNSKTSLKSIRESVFKLDNRNQISRWQSCCFLNKLC